MGLKFEKKNGFGLHVSTPLKKKKSILATGQRHHAASDAASILQCIKTQTRVHNGRGLDGGGGWYQRGRAECEVPAREDV